MSAGHPVSLHFLVSAAPETASEVAASFSVAILAVNSAVGAVFFERRFKRQCFDIASAFRAFDV